MRKNFWNFVFSPLFVLFVVFPNAFAALSDFDRQELSFVNLLGKFNGGFESGKANWTASGGTFAVTSTSPAFGKMHATWDSSAAGQTFTSKAVTVTEGLKGNNCEGSLYVQTPSGTATHTFTVTDGTNPLATATVVSSTYFAKQTLTFPCPSSGTMALQLTSVASNEPSIATDEGYIGLARNVGLADYNTEWTSFTPTGSWVSNTTYTGKWKRNADDYEYQIYLALTGAPTATSLTINHLANGITQDTSKLLNTSTDGRQTMAECIVRSAGTVYDATAYYNGANIAVIVKGTASTYATSATDVNATVPATFANGDAVYCKGKVPILGWPASTIITPDAQGWFAAGYISGANPDLGTSSVSTYTEITNSSLTLTPDTGSAPIGIVCSSTNAAATPSTGATTCSAGSEGVGFATSVPRAGRYEVCMQFGHSTASSASDAGMVTAFEIVNTATNSQTILNRMGPRSTSGHYNNPATSMSKFTNVTACGQATLSAGSNAFRLFYEQSSLGANAVSTNVIHADANASIGDRAISVTMRPITTENQAILANSVSTFNRNGAYMFGASVTAADCTSSPCTLYDGTTPGVTITRASTGVYSLNYASLGITKTPTCAIGHNRGSGDYKCDGGTATTSSQTIFCYQNTTGSTWVAVDSRPSAVCQVNR